MDNSASLVLQWGESLNSKCSTKPEASLTVYPPMRCCTEAESWLWEMWRQCTSLPLSHRNNVQLTTLNMSVRLSSESRPPCKDSGTEGPLLQDFLTVFNEPPYIDILRPPGTSSTSLLPRRSSSPQSPRKGAPFPSDSPPAQRDSGSSQQPWPLQGSGGEFKPFLVNSV